MKFGGGRFSARKKAEMNGQWEKRNFSANLDWALKCAGQLEPIPLRVLKAQIFHPRDQANALIKNPP